MHDFYKRADEVLTIATAWIVRNPWARRRAMMAGGYRDVTHDVWIRLVESNTAKHVPCELSTVVCNQVRWCLLKKTNQIETTSIEDTEELNAADWRAAKRQSDDREKQRCNRDVICQCKEVLTRRERIIVDCRIAGRTLEETGRVLRITRERVRVIESRATKKMQKRMNAAK